MSKPPTPVFHAAMVAHAEFFHNRFGVYPNARARHVWLYSNTPYPGMPAAFRERELAETTQAVVRAGYRVIGSTSFPWEGAHAGQTYALLVQAPPAAAERLAFLFTGAREANWRHGLAHDDGRPILPPWLRVETTTAPIAVLLTEQKEAFDRLTPKPGEPPAVITGAELRAAPGRHTPRDAQPATLQNPGRIADAKAVAASYLQLVGNCLPAKSEEEVGMVKFEWMTIEPDGAVQLAYTLVDADGHLVYFRDEYTTVQDSIDRIDKFAASPPPVTGSPSR